MGIQYEQKYRTKNEEIIASLRKAAGAGPPIDSRTKVKRLTAEIAVLMALIHGGKWRMEIDHEDPFVVVRPR